MSALASHFFAENQPELEKLAQAAAHVSAKVQRKIDAVKAEDEEYVDRAEQIRKKGDRLRERRRKKADGNGDTVPLTKGADGVWRAS